MDRLLTVTQVAERLQVDPKTVYRWAWANHLPHVRLGPRGGVIRFSEDALEKFLEDNT